MNTALIQQYILVSTKSDMGVSHMVLSTVTVRSAKTKEKTCEFADGAILVNPDGSKSWRLKYRYVGKAKLLAPGAEPCQAGVQIT